MFPTKDDWGRIMRLERPASNEPTDLAWYALHQRNTDALDDLLPLVPRGAIRSLFVAASLVYRNLPSEARDILAFARTETQDEELLGWIGYLLAICDWIENTIRLDWPSLYGMNLGGLGNQGRSLQMLAYAYGARGDYKKQICYMRKAIEALSAAQEHVWIERCLRTLCSTAFITGHELEYALGALESVQCSPEDRIEILRMVGKIYWICGDSSKAMDLLGEAHSMAYEIHSDKMMFRLLNDLSIACESLGEYRSAEQYARTAKRLSESALGTFQIWDDPSVVAAGMNSRDVDLSQFSLSSVSKDERVKYNALFLSSVKKNDVDGIKTAHAYFHSIEHHYWGIATSLELYRITGDEKWGHEADLHMQPYGKDCVYKRIRRTMPPPGLSTTEAVVWKGMIAGLSHRQIAVKCDRAEATIKGVASKIFSLTGTKNKHEFLARYSPLTQSL
jgi:tetratricopeptide (TPR) repeat protein/DNA-binding CsgD family transcriptional regulator